MGFLKNLAAKGLGSVLGDDLADAIIPDDIEKRVAKKASEKAVDAAVDAAVGASVGALTKRKKNSLATPPPPPGVPNMTNSIRVMVAVNGEQYGPYEKAGLVNMINEGTLTKETYVFLEGNTEWKFAKDVPEVNALFGGGAIPAPPTPFAPAPPTPSGSSVPQSSGQRDGLSSKLNSLIDATVADGEISDLERQVLVRNAQAEGVAMDEFVVILEARLFEQRRVLAQQEEEKKHRAESLRVQQQAAAKTGQTASPARPSNREMTKCPHCGAPIKALATTCPECGLDYLSTHYHTEWEKLSAKIQEIQEKEEPKRNFLETSIYAGRLFSKTYLSKTEQIINAITNCPIPINKNEIVEFFTLCAPLGKKSFNSTLDEKNMAKAYRSKAQQVLLKARIVLRDDPDLLSQLEQMAKQYKIKG